MSDLVPFVLAMTAVSQQVTEQFFGAWFSGIVMRFLAIGVSVGLFFGLRALEWGPDALNSLDPAQVAVLGVFSGLGSNIVHAIFERYWPKANEATLSGAMTDAAKKIATPQPPPAPPAPPSIPGP